MYHIIRFVMVLVWLTQVVRRPAGQWLARLVAPKIRGKVKPDHRHGKEWVRVSGEYQERSVLLSLGLNWGTAKIEMAIPKSQRIELYFRLDYDDRGKKAYERQTDSRDEWDADDDDSRHVKHFYDERACLTWSNEDNRLNAEELLSKFPSDLRDELIKDATRRSRQEVFFAWDTLEIKWTGVFYRWYPAEQIERQMALARRIVNVIEQECL